MRVETFVINLERAKVRRATMERDLDAVGLQARFIRAVDFKEVGIAKLRERFDDFGPWGIVPPQNMAICSSHRKVWEEFLKTDADVALVLEDDIFLSPDLSAWLQDMSWWPKDADLARLEVWRDTRMLHVVSRLPKIHRGHRITRIYSRHPGTAGYMISRRHAQRLLEVSPIRWTTDGFLFNTYVSPTARAANIYQIAPPLITQGNDPGNEQIKRTAKRDIPRAILRRQSLRRGWAELSNLPRHLLRVLLRQATVTKLEQSVMPADLQPPTKTKS
jgi:glycosyl transferase family 25